jgi:hypothetical protein
MKTNIDIEEYLKAVKDFQDRIPNSHVGGSIGLFLHGIDLKRSLGQSDIDMTVEDYMPEKFANDKYDESSMPEDFDYKYRYAISTQLYIKMDIRVCPEPTFEIINRNGIDYRVSKKRDILFWKDKYARKNVYKHTDDMFTITGLEKYARTKQVVSLHPLDDDLPF